MRRINRFRNAKDPQIEWQRKVIREEAREEREVQDGKKKAVRRS